MQGHLGLQTCLGAGWRCQWCARWPHNILPCVADTGSSWESECCPSFPTSTMEPPMPSPGDTYCYTRPYAHTQSHNVLVADQKIKVKVIPSFECSWDRQWLLCIFVWHPRSVPVYTACCPDHAALAHISASPHHSRPMTPCCTHWAALPNSPWTQTNNHTHTRTHTGGQPGEEKLNMVKKYQIL